jgi:hypothetical protein
MPSAVHMLVLLILTEKNVVLGRHVMLGPSLKPVVPTRHDTIARRLSWLAKEATQPVMDFVPVWPDPLSNYAGSQ